METEKPHEKNAIQKVGDTLLVLHHNSNTIGLVQGIDQEGHLKETFPQHKDSDTILHIDPNEESFTHFFTNFYDQLKTPSDFSFFKVTEYEALQTAKELQQYVDTASTEERQELQQYEISIDSIQAHRDQSKHPSKEQTQSTPSIPHTSNNPTEPRPSYRYQPEQINWTIMEKLGLTQEKLESLNALEPLLKGYKTPSLIPLTISLGQAVSTMDARLSLQFNDFGEVEVRIHGIRKEPDLQSKFFGHEFTKEDQYNLLTTGNMGRVVDLINPKSGEITPSLISRDRLTNELVAVRTRFIRIPLVIKGVTLNEEQKHILQNGKPLFIENMLSKRGTLFNATVQFNADKHYVEFLFKRNIKSLQMKHLQNTLKTEVPTTFRGKPVQKWQIEKLKAGETTYINGLTDSKEKKYQGYISFNKDIGKFEFSFKNPNMQNSVALTT